DFGVLRDGQAAHRDETEQNDDDRQHHRDDGPVDKEARHDLLRLTRGPSRTRLTGRRLLRRDHHAIANSLKALDDDSLAGFEAFVDDPQGVHALADLDVAEGDLVVTAHYAHAVEVLELLHRALWYEQRTRLVFEEQPGPAVLPRSKYLLGIRELELEAQG